jgi:hypothetical protein
MKPPSRIWVLESGKGTLAVVVDPGTFCDPARAGEERPCGAGPAPFPFVLSRWA